MICLFKLKSCVNFFFHFFFHFLIFNLKISVKPRTIKKSKFYLEISMHATLKQLVVHADEHVI